jgi:prepilin-type N-terminal cleavage/methylation domain-containing protein
MLRRVKGFTLIELLIVVAIIAILAAIAIPNFLEAQTRSKVARVKSDQRTLSTALEAYYIDNNAYPAQASAGADGIFNVYSGYMDGTTPPPGFGQAAMTKDSCLAKMSSFRIKADQNDQLQTLTTPTAFLSAYLADPFADTKGACFAYSALAVNGGSGWIIWSYGPNLDENKPWGTLKHGGEITLRDSGQGFPVVEETFFNPNETIPGVKLIESTYDPSNGTTSNGDVWRGSK